MRRTAAIVVVGAIFLLTISPTYAQNAWVTKHVSGVTNTVIGLSGTRLGKLQCYNSGNAAAFIQIFNAIPTAVTLGTTLPDDVLPIETVKVESFSYSNSGEFFPNGISIAATTTSTGAAAPNATQDCSYAFQ